MSDEPKNIVKLYIDSLAEHSGQRRLADLRNENSSGNQRTGGKAKGDALTAFDKEDFRQHVRQTLNDPNTKYFINEADDRIVFFNGAEANNSRITFTPAQLTGGDGHAGTLMRDSYNRGVGRFQNELDEVVKNTGVTPEIRSVSDGGWIEHLEGYRTQLENVPERVLGKGDLRTDYHHAGDIVKSAPLLPLDYDAPNAPAKKSMLRAAFEASAPMLKTTGMVILGAIPIIGILPNIVEARELETTLQTAIDNGQISEDALLAYNTILAGHIAQGADPTVLMGEAGIQASFNDWADRYNVQGDLRESLQPSSLALMLKDGSIYIAQNTDRIPQATLAVGNFAIEQTVSGAGYAMNAIDSAYDYMSGNTADMQDIYDGLPVLESAANDDTYDPSNIDANPIHSYPTAHDLAQIKTDIVNTQDMIGDISKGTKEPFNHMDKAESMDFLQGRIDRLNDRFENNYEQALSDGTLDEVTSYMEQHGEFNAVQSPSSLAVQDTEPAASQSWDAPKALAM